MLYCVLGNSGVGKSYITSKVLEKFTDGSLKPLILCTTRPKRDDERDGIDYYFLNDKIFSMLYSHNLFYECRAYDVANGDIYKYGTLLCDIRRIKENDYIVIASKTQFCTYCEKLINYIVPILLVADDNTRTRRALNRKGNTETEAEINRRLKKDIDMIDINTIHTTGFMVLNSDNSDAAEQIYNDILVTRETGLYKSNGYVLNKHEFIDSVNTLYNQLKGE